MNDIITVLSIGLIALTVVVGGIVTLTCLSVRRSRVKSARVEEAHRQGYETFALLVKHGPRDSSILPVIDGGGHAERGPR
jgi:hypothetical protein